MKETYRGERRDTLREAAGFVCDPVAPFASPLQDFHERNGVLRGIELVGGELLLRIGSGSILVPADLQCKLQDLVGCKIGILRIGEDYRIRRRQE